MTDTDILTVRGAADDFLSETCTNRRALHFRPKAPVPIAAVS